ncbi:MAG: cupin domain-containing protein [Myxococcota bacterium]
MNDRATTIRADFAKREVVHLDSIPWSPSPLPGVDRRMLDRIGDEVARATSVVRYAPNSRFPSHTHELGEEFFVLDGVFSDEHGDFPAGTYVRNPPGTSHSPHTVDGCEIFVKLRQFDGEDLTPVRIDTRTAPFFEGAAPGLEVRPLHEFRGENVALVRWAPGTQFHPHMHMGGEEILVVEGVFSDEFGDYPAGTWIRSPHASRHRPFSEEGCLIYVKTGHLK